MCKILILGDIHGRSIWYDIINKENPDKVIFLGDYVSTHDQNITSDQQIEELHAILNYKETNKDKVILLRGNHDCEALGYFWADCNPRVSIEVSNYIRTKDITNWFLSLTQWIYHIPNTNIVCSHAGISEQFLDNICKYFKSKEGWDFNIYDTDQLIDHINDVEPCELFGFTPCKFSDYCGISATQPCTWIRPQALLEYGVKDIIHVVGHTPVKHICNMKDKAKEYKDENWEKYVDVWCCDCLGNGEYLIIENNEFKPRKLA